MQRITSMASTALIYALLTGLTVLLCASFFETRFAESAHLESNQSKGPLSIDENNPSHIAGLEVPLQNKPVLLGVSMVTVKSNSLPPPKPPILPLPDPTSTKECRSQWQAYFSKKKTSSSSERQCCVGLKNCECLKKICATKRDDPACKGVNSCKGASCEEGHWTETTCMALPNAPASNKNEFNWLWILIVLAVLMILIICVAIWCVFRKKFGGRHDSKKDKRKGHISFGQLNVKSKVQWQGKGSSHPHHSKNRKSSKKSLKRQTSRKISGASVGKNK